ncbi:MAG TPA: exodeoxyribonuclease V subunit gamma [Acidimicrobiales bacterium]|nr:exodeoxyribonuclease V subunit gamma [Acidimicrobiales bacterium]
MLRVHRSERADFLADILAGVLGKPLDDPMAPEVVAVPTRGVERWLTQRLSHQLGCSDGGGDGVAANIGFPFPGSLIGTAVAKATGIDPEADPWVPERAVWPLVDVIDTHLSDPALSPLAEHLAAASPSRSDGALARFAAARHLADLYDQYGVHRPHMVRGWASSGVDGFAFLGRHAWQARLWRMLREQIGVPSPAERLHQAVERLADQPDLADLPERLSLFGLTRLPPSYLAVLEALANGRDVHLFLLHPSGPLWDVIAGAGGAAGVPADLARRDDTTVPLALNGLLRSWGRDAREMQLVLSAHGAVEGEYRQVDDAGPVEPVTLLQRIQHDIRLNAPIPPLGGSPRTGVAAGRPALDPSDTSLRLHSCHGRYRQVEVMREAILHILAGDPTLEARDVIVMSPDVEAFAPLIEAVFGGSEPEASPDGDAGQQQLRVKLADRSIRQTNPLLAVSATLLELAEGRVSASHVIDLAGREPVRRRFAFDDDQLAQIETWVTSMGARWGLDAEHRERWKLGRLRENTWEFGLDRLLLGVVMGEDENRLFGGALPLDDVPSGSVDLAGRFAEFVNRLGACVRDLRGRNTLDEWCRLLARATESVASHAPGESWQLDQMHRVLDEAVVESAGSQALLTLQEVRALLAHRLRGRPTRANFRTGDMTVCTLVPMRSVPHRVVCLLGLDDGVFPRHPGRDGDDLIAAEPHIGDRDARGEDRQLLLDALLAATDHLVITYCGRDERTNHPRPPAVPVAELLDAVDRTVCAPDGCSRAREAVVVEHPLQSFDPRNFVAGALSCERPWGFGRMELSGAMSLAQGGRPKGRFLDDPLPPRSSDIVNLDALIRFFKHPVQAFLRERLGVYVAGDIDRDDEPVDSLPIESDGLEKWAVGDRVLRALVRGRELDEVVRAERARGILPPGHLADDILTDITSTAERLVAWLESLVQGVTGASAAGLGSAEINLELPSGQLLMGTVPGLHEGVVVNAVYSRLGPKHRIEAWIRLLTLTACRPELAPAAVTVARSPGSSDHRPAASVIGWDLCEPEELRRSARDQLGRLVELYQKGMVQPLPLYCCTSLAWTQAKRGATDAFEAASGEWESGFFKTGEAEEACHKLVLGGTQPFNSLLGDLPGPGETGDGWDESETSRFGRLARRLWDPLLDHEVIRFP